MGDADPLTTDQLFDLLSSDRRRAIIHIETVKQIRSSRE